MPQKRGGRTRAAQHHAPTFQSDYDTDAPNMTDTAPVPAPAPVPPRTNEELNLIVLKRHDPDVVDVLTVANFAVVYIFAEASQQWEKCGIEGTLFVCKLAPEILPGSTTPVERYNIILINRKGLDNFSTSIHSSEQIQITEEYIIVEGSGGGSDDDAGQQQVYGLWIFSEPPPSSTAEVRRVTAEKIYECALRAENSREAAQEEAAAQQQLISETIGPHSQIAGVDGYTNQDLPPPGVQQIRVDQLFGQSQQQQQQQLYHQHQLELQLQQQQQQQQQHQQQPHPTHLYNPQINNPHFNNNNHQYPPQQQQPQTTTSGATPTTMMTTAGGLSQTPHSQSLQYQQQTLGGFPPVLNYNQQGQYQQMQQQGQQQQRDVLGDLFRNAKVEYNS